MADWKDALVAKTEETSPDNAADLLLLVDTSGDVVKKTTPNDLLGPGVAAGTSKSTPVDADKIPIADSAASNAAKYLTWANLKATAKTYLDTLYQPLSSVLTTIAGLSPSANDVMQYKSGAWTNRTIAQLIADLGLGDAMIFKGAIDCSANPNYPAANAGDTYKVSVAGKIGGASGINVEIGDTLICNTDSTSSGTQAGVGSAWHIVQANIDGAYFAGGTDVAVADGGTGSSTASGARTNLGLVIGTNVQAWDTDLDTWATKTAPAGTVVGTSDTQALTNKTLYDASNVTEHATTTASSATPTPTGDALRNFFTVTALAAGAVFAAPSGTPAEGNRLLMRVKDDGTARSLGFNGIYRAIGVTLPTTTVISKTLYLGAVYNGADSKWDVIAYALEA
jgi:hypothetical protein